MWDGGLTILCVYFAMNGPAAELQSSEFTDVFPEHFLSLFCIIFQLPATISGFLAKIDLLAFSSVYTVLIRAYL